MKALIDTNIVLDVLLNRENHIAESQQVLSLVRHGEIEAMLCATTITTIDYLVAKAHGRAAANRAISALLSDYEIAPVDADVLRRAIELGFADYEDAVLHAAATAAGADTVVTRDANGFARASLPVLSPVELVDVLRAERNQ